MAAKKKTAKRKYDICTVPDHARLPDELQALGLLSTLGGAALGVVFSLFVNQAQVAVPIGVQFVLLSDKLVVIPTAMWVVATVVFITFVVTVISVIPSFIAARLKPVTAMQHAG